MKSSVPNTLPVAKALISGMQLQKSSVSASTLATKGTWRNSLAVLLYFTQKVSKP